MTCPPGPSATTCRAQTFSNMVCALDKVGVLPGGRVLGALGAPQEQIRGERLGRDESDERGRSSLVRPRLYPSLLRLQAPGGRDIVGAVPRGIDTLAARRLD